MSPVECAAAVYKCLALACVWTAVAVTAYYAYAGADLALWALWVLFVPFAVWRGWTQFLRPYIQLFQAPGLSTRTAAAPFAPRASQYKVTPLSPEEALKLNGVLSYEEQQGITYSAGWNVFIPQQRQ